MTRAPRVRGFCLVTAAVIAACAPATRRADGVSVPPSGTPAQASPEPPHPRPGRPAPVVPATVALTAGWMPLRSTGADLFLATHPTYDGRGVLIGVLDTGVDPHSAGLRETSTGLPKVLDIRDFSQEGRVALSPAVRRGDSLAIGTRSVAGAERIASVALGNSPWYVGLVAERAFGPRPGGDLNGNGSDSDEFAVAVVRTVGGWVVFLDLDGDGSLADEAPIRDFFVARETFSFVRNGTAREPGPVGAALNLRDAAGVPVLDVVVDNAGHGTHVAGVAAGWRIGDVHGLNGVAPGAQLLALKIASGSRGGISVTGSILAAMDYARRFAEQRRMPLVLNLSFGVGNGRAGRAVIDSAVNAFLTRYPTVVLTVSAGNDGPGLSTVGFPGSADLALTVGALQPGPFVRPRSAGPARDIVAAFSARGGELAKPDLVAPGFAFSSIAGWDVGHELKAGTSVAAPHVAGLAALLISAAVQDLRPWTAHRVREALIASAVPTGPASPIEQGAGVPQMERAWHLLRSQEVGPRVLVRARPMGGNPSAASAALRRDGFATPGDTVQQFEILVVDEMPVRFDLRSDAPWLSAPAAVEVPQGRAVVDIHYHRDRLVAADLASATVQGFTEGTSVASQAFTLISTIVFPHDLVVGPLVRERRHVAAGGAARHFVRVPTAAGGLRLTLGVADRGSAAALYLFEPTGQPSRADTAPGTLLARGGEEPVQLLFRSEDLISGVYEIVVAAPPDVPVTYDLQAEVAPPGPAVAARRDTVVVSPLPPRTAVRLVGAERRWALSGSGDEPLRLSVVPPSWGVALEVEVAMAPEQWDRFTDLGVTVFDGRGVRLGSDPQSYPTSRMVVALQDPAPRADMTLELYPALALPTDGAMWSVEVRLRVITQHPTALDQTTPGRFTIPAAAPVIPRGWQALVEVEVGGAGRAPAVQRVAVGEQ